MQRGTQFREKPAGRITRTNPGGKATIPKAAVPKAAVPKAKKGSEKKGKEKETKQNKNEEKEEEERKRRKEVQWSILSTSVTLLLLKSPSTVSSARNMKAWGLKPPWVSS
jgi:hypothetical protein